MSENQDPCTTADAPEAPAPKRRGRPRITDPALQSKQITISMPNSLIDEIKAACSEGETFSAAVRALVELGLGVVVEGEPAEEGAGA